MLVTLSALDLIESQLQVFFLARIIDVLSVYVITITEAGQKYTTNIHTLAQRDRNTKIGIATLNDTILKNDQSTCHNERNENVVMSSHTVGRTNNMENAKPKLIQVAFGKSDTQQYIRLFGQSLSIRE